MAHPQDPTQRDRRIRRRDDRQPSAPTHRCRRQPPGRRVALPARIRLRTQPGAGRPDRQRRRAAGAGTHPRPRVGGVWGPRRQGHLAPRRHHRLARPLPQLLGRLRLHPRRRRGLRRQRPIGPTYRRVPPGPWAGGTRPSTHRWRTGCRFTASRDTDPIPDTPGLPAGHSRTFERIPSRRAAKAGVVVTHGFCGIVEG